MSNLSCMKTLRDYPLIKSAMLTILFLGLLLGFRWLWQEWNPIPEHPPIQQGVIDLGQWDFEQSPSMLLDGEWAFYPGQLEGTPVGEPRYVQVPGSWGEAMPDGEAYGSGTYKLTILLKEQPEQTYGFWIKRIEAASQVVVNGETQSAFGQLGLSKDQYKPSRWSYTATYSNDDGKDSIELLIRVSNYDNPVRGGIVVPIRFGSQAAIDGERWYSIGFQLMTFVILMLHGIYAIILYIFNRKQYAFLVFFMMMLSSALSIITIHDKLILHWLPVNYTWVVKLGSISYVMLTYFMLMLTRIFSGSVSDGRLFRLFSWLFAAYVITIMVLPIDTVHYLSSLRVGLFFYVVPVVWFLYLIGKMVVNNHSGAIFLLLSAIGVISSIVWGLLNTYGMNYTEYYPFDVIAAIIGFSSYWFKLYFRNAAENAKLNEQLRQSDKLKDQFLAHTSHELRTPIHGIINIAQTVALRERQSIEDRSYKDMELLITIGRRMSHLIEDLLDLVRLKDKHVVLQMRPIPLQSIAEGVIGMLGYLVEQKPVKLASRIPDSFPVVMADEKRLAQILFNLIHNGIKYTEKGEVFVEAAIVQGRAVVSVTDTGAGMDEATLARVFLPYEQGHSDNGGIGLGLGICKQLVELHGGTLTARSRPGKGTEFQFSLPLADSQSPDGTGDPNAAAQPWNHVLGAGESPLLAPEENGSWIELAPPEMGTHGVKQNILAIDDDPVNLQVLAGILGNDSYTITTAANASEALELLENGQWDLVISDVMMPGMSGYELTKAIRERYSISELPVLLLTARSQQADIYAGFSAGANDYLTKPVDALELKYRVWSLMTLKRSVTERLRLEAAYLQAQIHPHFLFNTLNSILALSDIDPDKMRKLAEAFTSYLRISFNFLNAGEMVPFAHELKLVRSYLYIEQERFGSLLSVEWEIDANIDLMLPPLSLQPIVENAVKHGALSRAEGGTVVIRIIRRGQDTLFEVKDNGKGMTQQDADNLLQHVFGGTGGIGIANTNRRLAQRYRQGLTIVSVPGTGTTVSFAIPMEQQKKDQPGE
jgi:two-component system sensor histidine kinase ChiS